MRYYESQTRVCDSKQSKKQTRTTNSELEIPPVVLEIEHKKQQSPGSAPDIPSSMNEVGVAAWALFVLLFWSVGMLLSKHYQN